MAIYTGPQGLVTNSLQIYLDWSNPLCYPGTGTQAFNLVDPNRNTTYLKGNAVYDSSNSGLIRTPVEVEATYNSSGPNKVYDRIDINTSGGGVDRFGAHSFSISYWCKWAGTNGARILSTGSAGSGTSDACIWQMFTTSDSFYWWNSSGGGANNITASVPNWHVSGQWRFITFTVSWNEAGTNYVRCYANDQLLATGSRVTAEHNYRDRSTQTDIQWTLGGGYYSSCYTANTQGDYGPFLLYNRTLSLSEITANYNFFKSRYGL